MRHGDAFAYAHMPEPILDVADTPLPLVEIIGQTLVAQVREAGKEAGPVLAMAWDAQWDCPIVVVTS